MKISDIKKDGNDSKYIAFEIGGGGNRRAWVKRREGDTDWANAPGGRYLHVARTNVWDGTPLPSPDFPIFNDKPDEEILSEFVAALINITGLRTQTE